MGNYRGPFLGEKSTAMYLLLPDLVREILDEQIPEPEGRSNPRVVKKTRAKFPSKKPIHKKAEVKIETLSFSVLNTA